MFDYKGENTVKKTPLLAYAAVAMLSTASAYAGVYEGQIEGEFNGWDNDKIYELADGHVIQQSSYHYHYHYAYRPHIIIYDVDGGLKIHVLGDEDQDVNIRVLK
jgi:hypothetical protein